MSYMIEIEYSPSSSQLKELHFCVKGLWYLVVS
jgi:hypothetical protein